jgi:hypothetical protein
LAALASLASFAGAQNPQSTPTSLENEVTERRAEYGVVQEQLRKLEEQQKTILQQQTTILRLMGSIGVTVLFDGACGVRDTRLVTIRLGIGRGCGTLKPGRHVKYAAETPMTNFFVAMLDRMGVVVDKVGDSTGEIGYLSDL